MRNASRLFLAAAVAAAAGPWPLSNHYPGGIPAPLAAPQPGRPRTRGKPTQSQIRRAARKRRNIRARSPMARKG